jgi:hypothetical protein
MLKCVGSRYQRLQVVVIDSQDEVATVISSGEEQLAEK